MTDLITAPDISTAGGLGATSVFPVTDATGNVLYKCTGAEIQAAYGGGGGGGGNFALLGTVVAGGGETALSLTGIAATYKNLRIYCHGQYNNVTGSPTSLTFNNDTSAKYDYRMSGDSANSGIAQNNIPLFYAPANTLTGYGNGGVYDVLDYAATNFMRTIIGNHITPNGVSTDSNLFSQQLVGHYRDLTTAINRVDFRCNNASGFLAGSYLQVYGVG